MTAPQYTRLARRHADLIDGTECVEAAMSLEEWAQTMTAYIGVLEDRLAAVDGKGPVHMPAAPAPAAEHAAEPAAESPAAEESGPATGSAGDPLSVQCPRCEASPGSDCVKPGGGTAETHAARMAAVTDS